MCSQQSKYIQIFVIKSVPNIKFCLPVTGGLSLAVEGPSKAEISCKDNKDGTCTVSYLPTTPGDYNIIVKFDNSHIPGSPFTAKITGTIRNVSLRIGKNNKTLAHSGDFPFSSLICLFT